MLNANRGTTRMQSALLSRTLSRYDAMHTQSWSMERQPSCRTCIYYWMMHDKNPMVQMWSSKTGGAGDKMEVRHHLPVSLFNRSNSSMARYSVKICRFAKKRPCIFCCAATQSGTEKKRTCKRARVTTQKKIVVGGIHQNATGRMTPVGNAIFDPSKLAALTSHVFLHTR
jgi:hypothetical protein